MLGSVSQSLWSRTATLLSSKNVSTVIVYQQSEKNQVSQQRPRKLRNFTSSTSYSPSSQLYEETAYRPWEAEAQAHQSQRHSEERQSGVRKDRRFLPSNTPIPDAKWHFFLGDYVKVCE